MMLDDFQQQWLDQNRQIAELVQLNRQLRLQADLAAPRSNLRWSQAGDVLEILASALGLSWTGSFIFGHLGETRFWLPAAALHLWMIGIVAVATTRSIRAAFIKYDATVLEIQRQVETLRVFALRSLRLLFVFGVPAWGVPFAIVASRAWLGLDLYALAGTDVLIALFATSVILALAIMGICIACADRLDHSPRLRQFARDLAGYNLNVAQDRLVRLAAFEHER